MGPKQTAINVVFTREIKKKQWVGEMNASETRAGTGISLETQKRTRILPSLELRRRSSDHPMVMFSLAVGVAFLSMAFTPTNGGPAFASFGEQPKVEGTRTTEKTSRLPTGETEFACRDPQQQNVEDDVCVMTFAAVRSAQERSQA